MKTLSPKRERFERVLPRRVESICENIRLLNNIAINSGNAYEYNPEELERAVEFIEERLQETKNLIKSKGVRFKL